MCEGGRDPNVRDVCAGNIVALDARKVVVGAQPTLLDAVFEAWEVEEVVVVLGVVVVCWGGKGGGG